MTKSTLAAPTKKLLRVLSGEKAERPPIWLMRQAGRYLPEYRELRATTSSFMEFCFNPAKAAEATLQPIRRFGFDAAIIFSDILTIPEALGQSVSFEAGEGPRLKPMQGPEDLLQLADEADLSKLSAVYEAIDRVHGALDGSTTLIGFCGAPWTVASYMIAGHGTPDQGPARTFAYRYPDAFQSLIDKLVSASIAHLSAQIRAGAEVVQIFDSWAGVLPGPQLERWCLAPCAAIADAVAAAHPDVRIIVFPRGAPASAIAQLAARPSVHGVSLDTSADIATCAKLAQPHAALQGNLDPIMLLTGPKGLEAEVDRILESCSAGPHIFNLGHGILPPTPIENVQRVLARIRGA